MGLDKVIIILIRIEFVYIQFNHTAFHAPWKMHQYVYDSLNVYTTSLYLYGNQQIYHGLDKQLHACQKLNVISHSCPKVYELLVSRWIRCYVKHQASGVYLLRFL